MIFQEYLFGKLLEMPLFISSNLFWGAVKHYGLRPKKIGNCGDALMLLITNSQVSSDEI